MAVFKYENKEDALIHIDSKMMMIESPDLGIDQKLEFIDDIKKLCELNNISFDEYEHQIELNKEQKMIN